MCLRGDITGSYYRWSLDRAALTDKTQGHFDPVHTVAASRDGQVGVSAAGDGSIAVWKLSGPQPLLARRIKNCGARRLCVSGDVKIIFLAGDENTVKRTGIWNGTESTLFDLPDTTATARYVPKKMMCFLLAAGMAAFLPGIFGRMSRFGGSQMRILK